MSNRLKEQNHANEIRMRHDNVGNYANFNGIRLYSRKVAMRDGDSTTVNGHTAPRGSIAWTTNATGRDQTFMARASTWEAISGAGGGEDVGGIVATGSYNFLAAPEDADSRLFNGVAFGWVADEGDVDATNALLPVEDDLELGDTLLGLALDRLVAVLN